MLSLNIIFVPFAGAVLMLEHSLQAYGFIRILYGIAQENTEYGKSDIIYGF